MVPLKVRIMVLCSMHLVLLQAGVVSAKWLPGMLQTQRHHYCWRHSLQIQELEAEVQVINFPLTIYDVFTIKV